MIIDKNNYNIELFHTAPTISVDGKKDGPKRWKHLEESLKHITIKGNVLEFGVFSGTTINMISKALPSDTIHGFDSFEGLPENWYMQKREKSRGKAKRHQGFFSVDKIPQVNENVKLWKGWFTDTLPKYRKNNTSNIKFLHVDCDLYSSTDTVFTQLNDYIVPGTVIVFDEFYPWGGAPYELWYEGEYKALKEWVEKHNRKFEVLSRNEFQQCAIKIIA